MNIINGSDLMLFVKRPNGTVKSLAFATSHTFNLTGETVDISNKDAGFWGSKEVTRITWQITTDNMYSVETYNELYDMMMLRQPVEVYFCLKTEAERNGTPATVNLAGDTYDSWTPTTAVGEEGYYGRVYITALNATASNGEKATFSATLDGIGAIAKGLYGSVESANGGSTDITIENVTYAKATGAFDAQKQYYIYSNNEMVEVELTSAKYAEAKQIYYIEKTT